jgi:hypothetical protein
MGASMQGSYIRVRSGVQCGRQCAEVLSFMSLFVSGTRIFVGFNLCDEHLVFTTFECSLERCQCLRALWCCARWQKHRDADAC